MVSTSQTVLADGAHRDRTSTVALLQTLIEHRVEESAHRILVQACENVGECTYAAFESLYSEAVHAMVHFHQHVTYRPGHSAFQWMNSYLFNKVVFYYQRMYAQPCLICEVCRTRSATWSDSDMDNFENLLSYLDIDLASELRSPISLINPVPSWVAEWMHTMFWDPWIRGVYWEPSRIGSRSLPIS